MLNDMSVAGIRVQTCVTSPPYWGLRDYGHDGAYGLESSPEEYIDRMIEVFRAVRGVLADDGTLWLNMGDSYVAAPNTGTGWESSTLTKPRGRARKVQIAQQASMRGGRIFPNMKRKDLVGIPWKLAFALREDGWYLRQDIIWHKPNPMPESVRDRCTKAHEYIFLLSKSERYFYDFDAMQEPVSGTANARGTGVNPKSKSWKTPDGWDTSKGEGGHGSFHRTGREKGKIRPKQNESFSAATAGLVEKRNKRSVWTIKTEAFPEAHFATFPRKLVEPCILAGSRSGDVVLDPFMGSGTTAQVAEHLGRQWIGCEINPEYSELQQRRLAQQCLPLDHD